MHKKRAFNFSSYKSKRILNFEQKLIQQNFPYESPKSLLDLLIAKFENLKKGVDPQTPNHSVEDRDIRSIPEHFLHPCTLKGKGWVASASQNHGLC